MRKAAILTLVFGGLLFGGQTFLLEVYQDGLLHPTESIDTAVLKLDFSLDTNCNVLFTVGGVHRIGTLCLVLDGDTVRNSIRANSEPMTLPFDQSYAQSLNSGQHTFLVRWKNTNTGSTLCQYTRLQALIFLPDTGGGAVAEQPAPETGRPLTSAVISRGPFVSAPGASTVVDAAGRVMENVLNDGKVQISNLPAGTYFAKDEERTVVKIVKVD